MKTFQPFASWKDVLEHVASGAETFYQAPFDYRPSRVIVALRIVKTGAAKIRIIPSGAQDFDAFTADSGHLERFRKLVSTEG